MEFENKDVWGNAKRVSFISYCDMGFGALSIVLSIFTFIYALPLNREGNEFVHDFVTYAFMASIILHFAQIFEGIMLLKSSEMQDHQEAVRLAKLWQLWSIFISLIHVLKLLIVLFFVERTFIVVVHSLFICLEVPYRVYWISFVNEFIQYLEMYFPIVEKHFMPYLWNQ